jgi:hypothetical protein
VNATALWRDWQDLLEPYRDCFSDQGFRRVVQWLTGLALNVEEHTVTQSLVALDLPQQYSALEAFVEYGCWDQQDVEVTAARTLEEAPGRRWHGYHVWAIDDSKTHRTSKDVWGVCTFHEHSARCPNRAQTVRAHNWVVLGALLHEPEQPAWFVPVASRLYFRASQLPAGETFRTKCQLLVELARQQAGALPGRHLAVFDGAFAVASVVRELICPQGGAPAIDFVTRLRADACLFHLPQPRPEGKPGRERLWGARLAPPRQGGRWPGAWQEGEIFAYGRRRKVRYKEVVCLWKVLGWERPVKAVVAEVEGYTKRFTLVSSALRLSGLQIIELFCARYRQEDGFRDLKQRFGWEECRAWTKLPILRTTQALFLVFCLLRLLQWRLEKRGEVGWWLRPPWNKYKARPSVLDLERLLRRHAAGIRACLSEWLGREGISEEGEVELVGM